MVPTLPGCSTVLDVAAGSDLLHHQDNAAYIYSGTYT
jgi:hypothetical protein